MNEKGAISGEDIAYERREWVIQRIAWVVMGLVVVAALLGFLGSNGPFATATLTAPDDSFQVEYVRIDHHNAVSELEITIAPEMVEDGQVRLWFDSAFIHNLGVESVLPEPESVESGSERVTYVFAVSDFDARGPLDVTFSYDREGYWWQHGHLGVEGGGDVELRQFVFP